MPRLPAVPYSNDRIMSKGARHTILLIQPTADGHSRTYTDHESVNHALQSIVETYENGLRKGQPTGPLTYSSTQLLAFIDGLRDVSALVFQPSVNAYVPYDRNWVKTRVYGLLQQQQQR